MFTHVCMHMHMYTHTHTFTDMTICKFSYMYTPLHMYIGKQEHIVFNINGKNFSRLCIQLLTAAGNFFMSPLKEQTIFSTTDPSL